MSPRNKLTIPRDYVYQPTDPCPYKWCYIGSAYCLECPHLLDSGDGDDYFGPECIVCEKFSNSK